MLVKYYHQFRAEVPDEVWKFLKRALILFICWKLIYHLVLYPIRVPDKWLTEITTRSSAWVYKKFIDEKENLTVREFTLFDKYSKENYNTSELWINEKKAVGVADSCNGLELYILHIGFLISYWISYKQLLKFLFIGFISIFIINTMRVAGLAWVNVYANEWFELAHHYLFKLTVYGLIFFLWIKYAKH